MKIIKTKEKTHQKLFKKLINENRMLKRRLRKLERFLVNSIERNKHLAKLEEDFNELEVAYEVYLASKLTESQISRASGLIEKTKKWSDEIKQRLTEPDKEGVNDEQ